MRTDISEMGYDKKPSKEEAYIFKLEQENAKLRAQLENTRLGLEKIEKLISHGDQLRPYANGIQLIESGSVDVCKDSYDTITAPTLADLIDLVALMGEKDDQA